MGNKKAIQLLDELLLRSDFSDQYGDMGNSSPYEEAVEIARGAIEKQIPKKLIAQNTMWGICPNCEKAAEIHAFREPKHCEHCGQALDWSSENE